MTVRFTYRQITHHGSRLAQRVRAVLDRWSPHVRNVEVDESHLGMGFAPGVLSIVAAEVERD